MLKKQHVVVVAFYLIMLFNCTTIFSQEYKGAVGVRFGYGIGVTGVYQLQNEQCLEFLLRYGYHGLILNKPGGNFQVVYEKHWVLRNSNFTAYVGGGPAIGFGKKTWESKQVYAAIGLSPIVGFDYTAQRLKIPLIIALDYKPTLNIDLPIKTKSKVLTDFSYYELGISVRFGIGRYNSYRRRR